MAAFTASASAATTAAAAALALISDIRLPAAAAVDAATARLADAAPSCKRAGAANEHTRGLKPAIDTADAAAGASSSLRAGPATACACQHAPSPRTAATAASAIAGGATVGCCTQCSPKLAAATNTATYGITSS